MEAWGKQFPSQLLSEVKYSFYSIRSSFGNKLFCVQTSKKHSKQSKIDQNIFHLVQGRHGEFEPDKAHSTVVGIICPPGSDRVNWSQNLDKAKALAALAAMAPL